MNLWDKNLQEVVDFIKVATMDEPFEADGNTLKPGAINWSWVKNWDKKYIQIRIDMRDGAFVLQDRNGKRITFEELKHQIECGASDEEI